jgi:hypothetical protein
LDEEEEELWWHRLRYVYECCESVLFLMCAQLALKCCECWQVAILMQLGELAEGWLLQCCRAALARPLRVLIQCLPPREYKMHKCCLMCGFYS